MSTDNELTYNPVRQVARFNIESIHYYPPVIWELIALHITETLEQHGCVMLPGQEIDIAVNHRIFGPWILKFEVELMNGQSFYSYERMASELRTFALHAGARKFESDFENVREK
jgi:hypothetical protein